MFGRPEKLPEFPPDLQGIKIQINPHPQAFWSLLNIRRQESPEVLFRFPPVYFSQLSERNPSLCQAPAWQIPPFCQLHSEFLASKHSQCTILKNCHQGKPSDPGAQRIHNISDNFLFLQSLISGCVAHRADIRSLVCTYIFI